MNNYRTGNQGVALHVLRRVRVIVRSIARALIRGTHAHLGRASVIMGAWFPGVRYLEAKLYLKSSVGSRDFVRCPESRSVRFSEAAYV